MRDKQGVLEGYLSISYEKGFVEEFAFKSEREEQVFSALANILGNPLEVRLSGYDVNSLMRFKKVAEIEQSQPALFRIIHAERIKEIARKTGLDENVLYAPYLS